jgi:hypothetical protein
MLLVNCFFSWGGWGGYPTYRDTFMHAGFCSDGCRLMQNVTLYVTRVSKQQQSVTNPVYVNKQQAFPTRHKIRIHHRSKIYGVRSSMSNWAPCAQLYTANDSPPTPAFFLFLFYLSLTYEGVIGQPK